MTHISFHSWLIAAALSALAIVGAIYFPTWQMPAPLSLAHADIENECAKCHVAWNGAPARLCLDCHKTTADEIATQKGEHATGHAQCNDCHVEHRGRDVYIVPTARGIAIQDSCVNCHANQKLLNAVAQANAPADASDTQTNRRVDVPDFVASSHGQLACVDCHRGDARALSKVGAHQGLINDPSADPVKGCGQTGCHVNRAARFVKSLHFTAQGLADAIPARSAAAHLPKLQESISQQCTYCHASCGQCHVNHPAWNDPVGLLDEHRFVKRLDLNNSTCNDCHSPADDYMGVNPKYPADVHWSAAQLTCLACHTDAALHGDEPPTAQRPSPADHVRECKACHTQVVSGKAGNPAHDLHTAQVECRVCHAQEYDNCYGCHVSRLASGKLKRKSAATGKEFRIGMLPTSTPTQPRYGLVAHVPVARDTYQILGDNLLTNFDAAPTWKPTAPHNITRQTKQNATCEACHDTPAYWLRPGDLDPQDAKANLTVAVTPPQIRTRVAQNDNGKTITLAQGAFLEVTLTGAPGSTGYVWHLVAGDAALVKPQFNVTKPLEVYTPGAAMPGAPGMYTFKFQAGAVGATTLKFIHARANSPADAHAETFTLTIHVRAR